MIPVYLRTGGPSPGAGQAAAPQPERGSPSLAGTTQPDGCCSPCSAGEQHPSCTGKNSILTVCVMAEAAVCGWLTSPYDTAVAVKQLGHTAIQRLVSGQQILLRYYDPAIHHILWAQLGNLQRDRWLGGLSGWHFLNGDGQLVSHCHTASPYPLMTFSLMLKPGRRRRYPAGGRHRAHSGKLPPDKRYQPAPA